MIFLAIETSSSRSSVAVIQNETTIFEEHFFSPRRSTGPLFSLTERALASVAGKPDFLAVGTGPGSYNGIRAGLALATGLQTALAIPCGGWSSLLALPPHQQIVAGDARGGQFYVAVVEDGEFLASPVLRPQQALDSWKSDYPNAEPVWIGETPPSSIWHSVWPDALTLAHIARKAAISSNVKFPIPEPLYLKPPHITPPNAQKSF